MNTDRNSNIYAFNAASMLKVYRSFATGTPNSVLAVVSQKDLSAQAISALTNSAKRLGFGSDVLWVQCETDCGASLEALDLRMLLIGCDPLALVATDDVSAHLLAEALESPCEPGQVNQLLGRTAVAFDDFEGMLLDGERKQMAWSLLKKLKD